MSELFLKILNMSITAGWIVLVIIVLRLLLKKAPKAITVLLWGLVGIRLICPFSIESVISLIPSTETVPQEILYTQTPKINSGITALNSTINPIIADVASPKPQASIEPIHIITDIAAVIWVAGICVMLVYIVVSYLRIYFKVREAVNTDKGIWQCDNIDTPFILGVFSPRIYLPSNITPGDMVFVTAHERAHLKRKDHLWKPLGFLLLCVYWFNPLMWVAYILLCRDIELACDEKVLKKFGTQIKKEYSTALLNCSVPRRLISACPVAFGEVGVKARIKSVLNYKKPAFWVVIVAVIVSVGAVVCLLTDPQKEDDLNIGAQKSGSDLKGVTLEIINTDLTFPDPIIEIRWKNESGENIIYGAEHHIYKEVNGRWSECCQNCEIWTLEGYDLAKGEERDHIYGIASKNMYEAGKYRFEAPFSIASGKSDNKAWLEFELYYGVSGNAEMLLEVKEVIYTAGSFSYVQSAENAPSYHIENGMQLYEESFGIVYQLGTLERIRLDENNYDSRFETTELSWENGYSLKELKKNNERAWQVYVYEGSRIYLLLEQSDGSYYLGFGYYDVDKSGVYNNTDGSFIRWFFKLESKEKAQQVEHIASNGAVYFYSKSFSQYDMPEYSLFYQPTEDELMLLLDYLDGETWIRQDLTKDDELYLNGQIYYNGRWIYFGYEDYLFYYDEYYCKEAVLPISQLKVMATKAVRYSPLNTEIAGNESVLSNDNEEEIALLKEAHPEYFGLNTANGVEVYIWQMAKNNYSCILLPSKDGVYTIEDIMNYHRNAVSIEEMRLILSTYSLSRHDITLMPTAMPYSSYAYVIDEAYKNELESIFWADIQSGSNYELYVDSVEFDIDRDGITETVEIGIGPTSGIFTFTLTVRENGVLEYFNIFESGAAITLKFDHDENGEVVLTGEALSVNDPEPIVYNIGVEEGNVYLAFDNYNKRVAYWGVQGVSSQYAPA